MNQKPSKNNMIDSSPPPHSGGMQKGDTALSRLQHVRMELAKLYREARRGQINVADASRLANLLQILARVMSDDELERRITELEKKVK